MMERVSAAVRRFASACREASSRSADTGTTFFVVALLGATAMAGVVRAAGLGQSFGGYHAFNEAFYTLQAIRQMERSFWESVASPGDFMNPPLFTTVLVAAFKILGVSEAAARAVSVACSMLTVFYVGLLGSTLYSRRAGSLAALLMAVTPASVLVGRNVQIEPLFVLLIVASVYHYRRAIEHDSVVQGGLAGALLGASILAKLPGVLVLAVVVGLETLNVRGFAWIKRRFMVTFLGSVVAVAAPWFLVQLLRNRNELLAATIGRMAGSEAGFFQLPDGHFLASLLGSELVWMFSPGPALVAALATLFLLLRQSNEDRLVLAIAGAFIAFFLIFHKHSYYLVPIVPFAALAIAELLSSIRRTRIRTASAVVLVAVLSFYSVLMLGGHKLARNELAAALTQVPEEAGVAVEIVRSFDESCGAIISYYRPRAEIRHDAAAQFPRDRPTFYVGAVEAPATYRFPGGMIVQSEVVGLTLLGLTFYQVPPNPHFFQNGPIQAQRFTDGGFIGLKRIALPVGAAALDGRMPYFSNYDPDS
jgi:4-amino-4-deoxy-L-arabinose transferase-like glycosyltransferase